MMLLNALIWGVIQTLKKPMPWLLKWGWGFIFVLLLSLPIFSRSQGTLSEESIQFQHLFWVQQWPFLEGVVNYLAILVLLFALGSFLINCFALGQYTGAVTGKGGGFWNLIRLHLPSQLLNATLFGILAATWYGIWAVRIHATPIEVDFTWSWDLTLMTLGFVLLFYIYEVFRIEIALQTSRSHSGEPHADRKRNLVTAIKDSVIGSGMGLKSLLTKPGLILLWITLSSLDFLLLAFFMSGAERFAFLTMQVGVMIRVMIDLSFFAIAAKYLYKEEDSVEQEVPLKVQEP